MIKLPKTLTVLSFILLLLALPAKHAYAAARIYFQPTSANVAQNSEFTLFVMVNAETNQIMGSDAVISYAGADLEVTNVSNGTNFFPEFQYANNPTGRLELHGYISAAYQYKTGTGTLASIKFKAKKGSGSSTISFVCTGSGNDTLMLNTEGTNILSCSQLNQAAITYASSGVPTPTDTPAGPTPTPTPQSGSNTVPYCASLTADVTTATGNPTPVTFACAGVDPDGYLNAAEFTFGDGTKQLVEQNAGSPGSISTKHTYTTIGTLGASCRVRDNNNVFSPVPDVCKKVITIRPKPTPTPRTLAYAPTGTIAPTPTPDEAEIIDEVPTPTETLVPSPTEEPVEESANVPWLILGAAGLFGVGGLLYLLGNQRRPPIPPVSPGGGGPTVSSSG